MKKRISCAALALVTVLCVLSGCGAEKATTGEISIVKDTEFGNIYIEPSIDGFNALGFDFGDSVDVRFDSGEELKDVPYYSGYYVPVGELLLCGYPGYPHPVLARNYGDPTWEEFGASESTRLTVTLNEKGKYLQVQELYALNYSDERNDFDSDVIFANFRSVKGGNLKEGFIFRSASPCDDQHNRAAYADRLIEDAGVRFVINLADNDVKIEGYAAEDGFDSPYYYELYRNALVLPLALNANYRSDGFAATISEALLVMTEHEGPVLVHCLEGKDRTGFVCALILALAGGSAQEVIDDYMITYGNYYKVTKESAPDKYDAILGNVYDFMYCLCEVEKGADVAALDLKAGAENYLRRGGLTDDDIAVIEGYICK
ncbi:MAG: tyrosine-protein phosphatase [Clostridia bacterium]|nr:tyrosine-protein phosphatase [Clostridia bacterium]